MRPLRYGNEVLLSFSVIRTMSHSSSKYESVTVLAPAPVSPLTVPRLKTPAVHDGLSFRPKPSSTALSQSSSAALPAHSSTVDALASEQAIAPPAHDVVPSRQLSVSPPPSQLWSMRLSSEPSA